MILTYLSSYKKQIYEQGRQSFPGDNLLSGGNRHKGLNSVWIWYWRMILPKRQHGVKRQKLIHFRNVCGIFGARKRLDAWSDDRLGYLVSGSDFGFDMVMSLDRLYGSVWGLNDPVQPTARHWELWRFKCKNASFFKFQKWMKNDFSHINPLFLQLFKIGRCV